MTHHSDQEHLTTTTTPPPPPAPPQGCCGRVCAVLRGITIEPVLFLYVFAMVMMASVTTNLLLDKECLEFGYTPQTCDNLTFHPAAEEEVQAAVTVTRMYISLIASLPTVIFVLFLGPWSDRYGCLLPILLPLVGQLLSTVVFVVNVFWMTLPSSYLLFSAVPVALSGGLSTLLMASFSYVSSITKTAARTTRIAFVDLGFSLGSPIGLLLSDLMYYRVGYLGVYLTGAGLFVVAIIYTVVRIRDSGGGGGGGDEELEVQQRCLALCDAGNVRKSFATALKRRPNRGRARILALIAALCLMVSEFGGLGMDYLYTKHVFGWSYNQYVQLSLTQLLLGLVGASVVLPVLSYHLQVADTVLVVAGCGSKIASLIMFALANSPYLLYLSSVVSLIGGYPLIITRSLISKVVPAGELGAIFSVLAAAEALIPLAAGPIYTAIYTSSISALPSAIYFFSAGLYLMVVVIVICVFFPGSSTSTSSTTTTSTSSTSSNPVIHHIHADDIPDIDT